MRLTSSREACILREGVWLKLALEGCGLSISNISKTGYTVLWLPSIDLQLKPARRLARTCAVYLC